MRTRPLPRNTDRPSGAAPDPRPRGIRYRDRHGRGLRGPVAPPPVPLNRTRAERFDDLVLDAVELVERRWSAELAQVEFVVDDVPPVGSTSSPARRDGAILPVEPVPLGRTTPGDKSGPPRITVYRRPVEARSSSTEELEVLVYRVIVEETAKVLGLEPEAVDPTQDGEY